MTPFVAIQFTGGTEVLPAESTLVLSRPLVVFLVSAETNDILEVFAALFANLADGYTSGSLVLWCWTRRVFTM